MDHELGRFEKVSYEDIESYLRGLPELIRGNIEIADGLKPGQYLKYTHLGEAVYLVNPYADFVWKDTYSEVLTKTRIALTRACHRAFGQWVNNDPLLRDYQFTSSFELMVMFRRA